MCAVSAGARRTSTPTEPTILATNNFHGRIEPPLGRMGASSIRPATQRLAEAFAPQN
jgi:hypothetical protein